MFIFILSSVLVKAKLASAVVLYSNSFDNGDIGVWDYIIRVQLNNTIYFSSPYSAQSTTPWDFARLTKSVGNPVNLSVRVYDMVHQYGSGFTSVLRIFDHDANIYAQVDVSPTQVRLTRYFPSQKVWTHDISTPSDSWWFPELEIDYGTSGGYKLYINDALAISDFGIDTTDPSSTGNPITHSWTVQLAYGAGNGEQGVSSYEYWDNFVVANNHIGPLGIDTSPPTFGVIDLSTYRAGVASTASCTITDDQQLSYYIISTSINSGSWTNSTPISVSSTPETVSAPLTNPSNEGDTLSVKFYANDTENNWGSSSVATFNMIKINNWAHENGTILVNWNNPNGDEFRLGDEGTGWAWTQDNWTVRDSGTIFAQQYHNGSWAPGLWSRDYYDPVSLKSSYGLIFEDFSQNTTITFNGNPTCRIALLRPNEALFGQGSREFESGVDINPYQTDIWLSKWIYIPKSTYDLLNWKNGTDTNAAGSWCVLSKFSERLYDPTRAMSSLGGAMNMNFGIGTDVDKMAHLGNMSFFFGIKGQSDNNNDHVDEWQGRAWMGNSFGDNWAGGATTRLVPVTLNVVPEPDRWFEVTIHIFRNVTNFSSNALNTNGEVQVWLRWDNESNNRILLWNATSVPTISVDPTLMNSYPHFNPGGNAQSYGYSTPNYAYGYVALQPIEMYTGNGFADWAPAINATMETFIGPLNITFTNNAYTNPVRVSIEGVLKDKNNQPVNANIIVYQSGTNTIVATNQTELNGNYFLNAPKGTYDIQFNLTNFYIPNYAIKIFNLSITNDTYDIIKQITGNSTNNNVSFVLDVNISQDIEIYGTSVPLSVKKNDTALTNVNSLSNLANDTWFYLSSKLYMIVMP